MQTERSRNQDDVANREKLVTSVQEFLNNPNKEARTAVVIWYLDYRQATQKRDEFSKRLYDDRNSASLAEKDPDNEYLVIRTESLLRMSEQVVSNLMILRTQLSMTNPELREGFLKLDQFLSSFEGNSRFLPITNTLSEEIGYKSSILT